MIRGFQLADFFTLGNAGCGVAAVLFAMLHMESKLTWHIHASAALMTAAFVFDVLDGRIARWRHQHSALGRELDSLADVISFWRAANRFITRNGIHPRIRAIICTTSPTRRP